MLSLSLNEIARRTTWTCLSCTSQAAVANWSRPLRARTHHRRHSSSKPSSPPKDVPRTIDAPAEAPGKESKTPAQDAGEKRSSTRLSRRKSKDGPQESARRFSDEALLSIPSVPSTQHLHPQGKTMNGLLGGRPTERRSDIYVASFFSIHRPISVTASVPPASSPTVFSSIFTSKNHQKTPSSQVIYTISSAVHNLESSAASPRPSQRSHQLDFEESDQRTAITRTASFSIEPSDPKHQDLENQSEVLHLNLQELVKNFRPFAPPPPPVAMDDVDKAAQAQAGNAVISRKTFSAVLTILESTHADGHRTYETRTSPVRKMSLSIMSSEGEKEEDDASLPVETPPPRPRQPFLNHMRERQQRWEEFRERSGIQPVWRAISVKRQRRLKMKKHKYKKLMRRTRTLRRKLDKT